MKSNRWWARFPGEVYANTFDFWKPVTEKRARKEMREYLGTKKLPSGTEVWRGK